MVTYALIILSSRPLTSARSEEFDTAPLLGRSPPFGSRSTLGQRRRVRVRMRVVQNWALVQGFVLHLGVAVQRPVLEDGEQRHHPLVPLHLAKQRASSGRAQGEIRGRSGRGMRASTSAIS